MPSEATKASTTLPHTLRTAADDLEGFYRRVSAEADRLSQRVVELEAQVRRMKDREAERQIEAWRLRKHDERRKLAQLPTHRDGAPIRIADEPWRLEAVRYGFPAKDAPGICVWSSQSGVPRVEDVIAFLDGNDAARAAVLDHYRTQMDDEG